MTVKFKAVGGGRRANYDAGIFWTGGSRYRGLWGTVEKMGGNGGETSLKATFEMTERFAFS